MLNRLSAFANVEVDYLPAGRLTLGSIGHTITGSFIDGVLSIDLANTFFPVTAAEFITAVGTPGAHVVVNAGINLGGSTANVLVGNGVFLECDGLAVLDFGASGFGLELDDNAWLFRVNITNSDGATAIIGTGAPTTNVAIIKCNITTTAAPSLAPAINFTVGGVNGLIMFDNYIELYDIGILFGAFAANLKILDNDFINCISNAIIFAAAGPQTIFVEGNIINGGCLVSGMDIFDINEGRFIGNQITNVTGFGLNIDSPVVGSEMNIFSNNIIDTCGLIGINVVNSAGGGVLCQGHIFTGNVIANSTGANIDTLTSSDGFNAWNSNVSHAPGAGDTFAVTDLVWAGQNITLP